MAARLVVSLSPSDPDSAGSTDRAAAFAGRLDRLGVPLSLLVAPRPGPLPVRWLVERAARGDALVLHGYDHSTGPGRRRAEFAALPAHEAGLRLVAALRELERHRLTTRLFAPPRWLASAGTLTALHGAGFAVCADATAVRFLQTGETVRGRVLTPRVGPLLARGLIARTVRRDGLVRLALDAADLDAALDLVELALALGARPCTYASLRATSVRAA